MIWPNKPSPESILGMMGTLLLFVMYGHSTPISSTPPKIGEPTAMLVNFTASNNQVIGFEIFWNGKEWMARSGDIEAPISNPPDKNDERIKIYATDWCDCK